MTRWLYIFAGFPGKNGSPGDSGLNAGGLRYCVEDVEELAILESDPTIRLDKEGVIRVTEEGEEWLEDFEVVVSDLCLRDGITWDWFSEKWSFGNGVVVHKTLASPEYQTVVHGTSLSLDQFLALHGPTNLANLQLHRVHNRHEGWEKYETRWLPGTCPMDNHVVHLTWIIATHKLPVFAYERIHDLIENGAELKCLHRYDTEKHFSQIRQYDGKPAFACTT
jgi:hypothetical protein